VTPTSRPTELFPRTPAGYFQLESYSSYMRLWQYLERANAVGREVVLVRGDKPEVCRRTIRGFTTLGAGALLDIPAVLESLEITPQIQHPVLLELRIGNATPLVQLLSSEFQLQFTFTLALTRSRTLILKASCHYQANPSFAHADAFAPLELKPKHFSKDIWRVWLERACG
jgi:hypothetical protein